MNSCNLAHHLCKLFILTNLGAAGQDSSSRESNQKGWRLINIVSVLRAFLTTSLLNVLKERSFLGLLRSSFTFIKAYFMYCLIHSIRNTGLPNREGVASRVWWTLKLGYQGKSESREQTELHRMTEGAGYSYRTCDLKHSQKENQDIYPEFSMLWVIVFPSDYWHNSLVVLWVTFWNTHLL